MWNESYSLEELDIITKEASVAAKAKGEEIKRRRANGTTMSYGKQDAGGAGNNRGKQLVALNALNAGKFIGGNDRLPYKKQVPAIGYGGRQIGTFAPVNNQYRREQILNQLGIPSLGSPNVGNLSRIKDSVPNGLVSYAINGANVSSGRPYTRESLDAAFARLRARKIAPGAGNEAGNEPGINPWLLGAGALGTLGAAGAAGYGLSHLGGDDFVPGNYEYTAGPQADDDILKYLAAGGMAGAGIGMYNNRRKQ